MAYCFVSVRISYFFLLSLVQHILCQLPQRHGERLETRVINVFHQGGRPS